MTTIYLNKDEPERGSYEVTGPPNGPWRWTWRETAKGVPYAESGPWFNSPADAWRDAADDWDNNGSGADRRYSGRLRAAATKASKEE